MIYRELRMARMPRHHHSLLKKKKAGKSNDKSGEKRWNCMRSCRESLKPFPKHPSAPVKTLHLSILPALRSLVRSLQRPGCRLHLYDESKHCSCCFRDGSAVLGLGNIGPKALCPLWKARLSYLKNSAVSTQFPSAWIPGHGRDHQSCYLALLPAFGGINLEDISAPRCFRNRRALKRDSDIPVFHDDQHGTAIVVLAGIINALKVVGKKKEDCRVVVNGAGSAGVAITRLLLTYGFSNIIMCDKSGILCDGAEGLNWMQEKMVKRTNLAHETGSLADALKGC